MTAQPRAQVQVWAEGDDFVTEWEGREFRAGNPFRLDSDLDGYVPRARDLHFNEGGRPKGLAQ